MADLALRPLTPLGRAEALTLAIGPVTIAEVFDVALASLALRRGRGAEARAAAERLGLPLPPPGRAAQGATYGAFWIAPDQWMVEAPLATHEDVVAALGPAFDGAASMTEQTDGWARLDVQGPLAPLMERLCNLDLDAFSPGSATRTLVEHMGVLAVRRAEDRMTLLGARSSAPSLLHAVEAAARAAF